MTRRVVILAAVLAFATIAAGCSSAPSDDEVARAELLAADPIFTADINRPIATDITYDYGDDPLWESDRVQVIRNWRSDGTADLAAVAELVDVAAASGWVGLTAECNDWGEVWVDGEKTFNDGVEFTARLIIGAAAPLSANPDIRDTVGVVVGSQRPESDYPEPPIADGTPAIVDLSCLYGGLEAPADPPITATTTSAP